MRLCLLNLVYGWIGILVVMINIGYDDGLFNGISCCFLKVGMFFKNEFFGCCCC